MKLKVIVSLSVFFMILVATISYGAKFTIEANSGGWTGTVYIRADGSIDPPDAPIITYDNVTYTLTGNITSSADGIVVERDNIVIDGAHHTVQGAGHGYGIYLSKKSNVTIKKTRIENFQRGICLFKSSTNNVSNNNVENNHWGIMLIESSCGNIISRNSVTNNDYGISIWYSSDGNVISGNKLIANRGSGIEIAHSLNNEIYSNNIKNCEHGIIIWHSSSNDIAKNNLTDNWCGIWIDESKNNIINENIFSGCGLVILNSYSNSVSDNIVNGKPLVYFEETSDLTIKNAGQVILIRCDRIIVENLNLSDATVGIELFQTNNTLIRNNLIANNWCGIWLYDSSNSNYIVSNNITDNWYLFYYKGYYINYKGYGVCLWRSFNNYINNNDITRNYFGIELTESSNNNIAENNVTCSWLAGINIRYSSGNNYIYHNNFVDNYHHVNLKNSINTWDNGYPSGGNYWSNYDGIDLYSGPYQNETGSDGIGDTPYVIDANNIDHYPLMKPWAPSINATTDVIPNILNLRGRVKYVTAYIEIPEGYNVSEIDVSSILLNNTIPVDPNAPIEIGDYDNDTIPDLMVKFNGTEVIEYILNNINVTKLIEERFLTITLTLTGKLNDGTQFQGSDTIRITMPTPRGIGRHIFPT